MPRPLEVKSGLRTAAPKRSTAAAASSMSSVRTVVAAPAGPPATSSTRHPIAIDGDLEAVGLAQEPAPRCSRGGAAN